MILIFDVAPVGGGISALLGLAFFFIFAAIAFVAYKMLKKTVKMAVRMAVVIAILAIAFVGSIALLWFGSGAGNRPVRPVPPTATQKPR
jgi:EamA domain-containing membrane protein RarD